MSSKASKERKRQLKCYELTRGLLHESRAMTSFGIRIARTAEEDCRRKCLEKGIQDIEQLNRECGGSITSMRSVVHESTGLSKPLSLMFNLYYCVARADSDVQLALPWPCILRSPCRQFTVEGALQ